VSTYIVASLPLPLYCGILLLEKQHETKLVSILYCSLMSSSCIILLIIQQLRLPCSSWSSYCNILYPCSFYLFMGAHQIILMCSLARPRRLMASIPLYDIIVIQCGIVPTSLIAASCQLYCCMISSCGIVPTLLAALLPTRFVIS
jgi:hypothetical protein